MTAKIPTPVFDDSVRFDQYEVEVNAWCEVTGLEKEKRALVLVLAMPDKKAEILESLKIEDLKKADGVTALTKYLKENYGKDDLVDCLDCYEDFRNYQRHSGQTIAEYCTGFEQRNKRVIAKGVTLPGEILAFELIRNARISSAERKLVLTGLDFSKKNEMYNAAKVSLKKFLGEGCSSVGSDFGSSSQAIKVEPAYAAWHRGYNRGYRGPFRGQRAGFSRGYRGANGGSSSNISGSSDNLNPVGRDGNRLTCFKCGSYRHMRNQCPHRTNDVNFLDTDESNDLHANEKCTDSPEPVNKTYICENHIILYTGYDKDRVSELCRETAGCAILDSACASNVAGEEWFKDYVDNHLSDVEKRRIQRRPGGRLFRFGGGPVLKSVQEVDIPISIGEVQLMLTIDIVQSGVPLLLSKKQMKEYGMVLDLSKDELLFRNKKIWLEESESGHYMLPLVPNHDVRHVYAVVLANLNGRELKTALNKLHNQFGHPTQKKLQALLLDAKVGSDEHSRILDEIAEKCQICKQYKKTPDRPVVSLPIGKYFNDALCIDLKSRNVNSWILHMIDMHTRFTRSVLVDRKLSSGIIDKIMKDWVAIFGVPSRLLSDNGGEFTSNEIREVSSYLNVVKYTTAAEAPWQNGLCERVHQVTDMILLKLEATYPDSEVDVLLAWANMARNSLQMYNGFSSHQLVFGVSPNLPNILHDELPAMTETTGSEVFAKHLNLLHASREAFIQSDASMRIKKALRHKLRCSQKVYIKGDWVYYKRDSGEKWLGPAKVMFQDGKIVFVRHGSEFYRVSVNRLNPAGDPDWKIVEELEENTENKDVQVKDLCCMCQQTVEQTMKALECDQCKLWCHTKCADVKDEIYDMLSEMETNSFQWVCPKCLHTESGEKLNDKPEESVQMLSEDPSGRVADAKPDFLDGEIKCLCNLCP